MSPLVLHVSPHPDDELIGAPAALFALRDAGHEVVNLVASLGRQADRKRRRREAQQAADRAGFELVVPTPPLEISRGDDLVRAEAEVQRLVGAQLDERGAGVVISPSPHDRHHGHEVVARGVRAALRERSDPPIWWMWGLWGALAYPTLFVPFDESRRAEIIHALEAHAGETARNDYRRLVEARARANAVLGAELVFGFGTPGRGSKYAELLTEVLRHQGGWQFGRRRELDPLNAFDTEPLESADAWVEARSPSELFAGGGAN